MNLLISLYDMTGNWSRPYRESGNYEVVQVDIQNGQDILDLKFMDIRPSNYRKIVILIAQPCTNDALSGAKHFAAKDQDGRTDESDLLVAKSKEIKDYFNPDTWALENPKTRIHKRHSWIGQRPKFVFHPADFAGYDPNPDDSRYNKETWLFGKFNDPVKKRLEPLGKEYPGFKNLGGKSLETKNARSITPLGFAFAFYEANH